MYEDMRDNSADGFIDAADYADVAEYYLSHGDEARAKEAAERGVGIFPDSLPPLAVLARINLTHGRIEEAREIISHAADKDDLEYHYVQAELMIVEGQVAEADAYLESLAGADEPDELALDACAVFIDHGEFTLARKWLDKVKDRSKADVQDFEAHILTGLGELEEGERKVNELIDEDPYSTEHWNHLAGVQYLRGNYNDSIDSSEFTLAIDPKNAEALLNKANSFYALKSYEQALPFYERFLKLRPNNVNGLYYYGVTLALVGDHDMSVSVLRRTLELVLEGVAEGDTQSEDLLIDLLHELSFELIELQEYDLAKRYIDQAIEAIDHHTKHLETADLYLTKAKVCFFQGDGDGAMENFDLAREVSDTPETFVRMTAILYEVGYADRAYDVLGAQLFSDEGRDWTTGHAYLARYAYEIGQTAVFNMLVPVAVQRNIKEARQVLEDIYPVGTNPKDYPFTDPLPLDDKQ